MRTTINATIAAPIRRAIVSPGNQVASSSPNTSAIPKLVKINSRSPGKLVVSGMQPRIVATAPNRAGRDGTRTKNTTTTTALAIVSPSHANGGNPLTNGGETL